MATGPCHVLEILLVLQVCTPPPPTSLLPNLLRPLCCACLTPHRAPPTCSTPCSLPTSEPSPLPHLTLPPCFFSLLQVGFINWHKGEVFDVEEYEHYEQVRTGREARRRCLSGC